MQRTTSSVTKLALTALLVGIAAVGCAKNNGAGAGTSTGQQATFVPAMPSDQARATDSSPMAADSTAPDASADPNASSAPGGAGTQIDDQLNAIDQALSNLNGSLSGADAGPSAGE
jgi:hypothetical protein